MRLRKCTKFGLERLWLPANMTYSRDMKYFEEAGVLWRTHVPASGQADTVQGELMRAVEKLRDEARRNGNQNWRKDHAVLANYVRDTLTSSGTFTEQAVREIQQDVERLLDYREPEASNEPYDRLVDRVVEWSRAHPEPVPHAHNPELQI